LALLKLHCAQRPLKGMLGTKEGFVGGPLAALPVSALLWACAFHGPALAASASATAPLCLAAVVLWVLLRQRSPEQEKACKHSEHLSRKVARDGASKAKEGEVAGALEGVVLPEAGEPRLVRSNFGEPQPFENEYCKGRWFATHKPENVQAPYGEHYSKKKRLWEVHWQLEFKKIPERSLVFGLELQQYVPLSPWARQLQGWVVKLLQQCVGNNLYHSAGDDPTCIYGEAELPTFVMPLWAFDQVIISQAGQEPDIQGSLEGLGIRRTDCLSSFVKEMSELTFEPGKVYTFSFWSISRFLDAVNWQMVGLAPGFSKISFDTFCGSPPVNLTIYELADSADPAENRHLPSRKCYYFRAAIWSSLRRPAPLRLAELGIQDSVFASNSSEEESSESRRSCFPFGVERVNWRDAWLEPLTGLASHVGCACVGPRRRTP